jgi:hypothetical protein
MKTFFYSVIDGLHHLFAGEQEEEISFREKLQLVVAWLFIIGFCVMMMNLFL